LSLPFDFSTETILRKLFIRTVKKLVSGWDIKEAASPDAAYAQVEAHQFDLIFMDQYMPSIERPMLGTDIVRDLRARGFQATICGLSANDLHEEFSEAGADGFMLKPFPCKGAELRKELLKLFKNQTVRHERKPGEADCAKAS
jgi:CheY-like chemotaxis protein